jgi:outer membrane lipoprotein-sorting protein
MRSNRLSVLFLTLPLFANVDSSDPALARLDRAASGFKNMSASIRRTSHTAVINEDNVDSGTMLLKRAGPKDTRMLIDLTEPDPKTVAFQGRKLEIYYPKIATVQEYDVGKNKNLLDQFLLLGFGSTSKELESAYDIRVVGPETVAGQKTTRLELIPKSSDVQQHLKKVELWIAETGYPAQQKFYLPAGDYSLVTYTDLKPNVDMPDSALRLKLPKNVKREYPQR